MANFFDAGENAALVTLLIKDVTWRRSEPSAFMRQTSYISVCDGEVPKKIPVCGIDLIKRPRPITFDWKEDKKTDIGLSAKGAVEGVKYDRVGVVLINAVQEQHIKMLSEQLETQEKKVADQRREIDSLRNSICALLPKATVCNQ